MMNEGAETDFGGRRRAGGLFATRQGGASFRIVSR